MKESIDSDNYNLTMLACNTFDRIINQIRDSNLNFQLQMSPFSAQISLKKTLILEKTGVPRLPPIHACVSDTSNTKVKTDIAAVATENLQLKNDLESLRVSYSRVVDDCSEAFAKIKFLEATVLRLSIKKENDPSLVETFDHDVSRLTVENKKHEEKINDQIKEICELESSLKVKTEIANQLNKKFSEFKTTIEKEKAATKKAHRAEIKFWRKELGEERRRCIKLEAKLEGKKSKEFIENVENKKKKESCSREGITNSCKHDCHDKSDVYHTPFMTTSMVSHWSPYISQTSQRPSSITSMVARCALHPPPGSSLLSMAEVLEALNKAVERLSDSMKWLNSSD